MKLNLRNRWCLMFPAAPAAPAPSRNAVPGGARPADLATRMAELAAQTGQIRDAADAANRDLTADEMDQIETIDGEFARLEREFAARERIAAQQSRLAQSAGRQTDPAGTDPPAGGQTNPQLTEPATAGNRSREPRALPAQAADTARWGWRSFGEFALAVQHAARPGGRMDNRLVIGPQLAPSTYGSEGTGADGGFAVPPDFRSQIMELVMAEASLLGFTDQLTSSGSSISVPKDESTPWQTSGGIQCYWEGEGGAITQSKPVLTRDQIPLNKLTALVPVTEELLEDAPAMDSYLRRKAPEKMGFKINLALIQGNGVGQPLGLLNSGALVSVAKEGGQGADTIVFNNLAKMWSRCYAPSRMGAIWVINQDVEFQLFTLVAPGGMVPAYLPANGLAGTPYGTLFGRPVIPTQACETLGDKGDIFLADFRQYATAQRAQGLRTDTSIHLYFDTNHVAYRFIWRLAGRPWWTSAISPRDGANTLSPFVTLDERA